MIERPYPASFIRNPFDGSDIQKLASFVVFPITPSADLNSLAELLSSRFRKALDWVSMDEQGNSKADIIRFSSEILKHGEGLLSALGMDRETSLSIDEITHLPAILQLGMTPGTVAENYSDEWTSGTPLGGSRLLGMAGSIRALMIKAKILNDQSKEISARSGRPNNNFYEVLFNSLAFFHYDMFGRAPEIDTSRGDRRGESIDWARDIINLAKCKIPPVLIPNSGLSVAKRAVELEIQALNDAAALADSTVADRLKNGAAFARRHIPSPEAPK